MSAVARHAALAVALWALAAAGWRIAAWAGARGLERVLAAAVVAVAAAVAWSLALGLAALGTNVYALVGASVLTWAATLRVPPVRERWRLTTHARVLAGALAGVVAAWTAWLLLHPALGHDMLLYHLPEAIDWVHDGHPGSIHDVVTGLPVGAYPLTYEVLLSFGLGIAHSFVPATLAMAAAPVLVVAAAIGALRALAVPALARSLAAAPLVATPAVLAAQSGGAALDPAALGWLVTCAALCLASRESPRLVAIALVAAGLAIGTKTTTAPLAALVLAVTLIGMRGRADVRAIGVGFAAALLVGGIWFIRDFAIHGSPVWPFYATPWGDPQPPVIAAADISFLDQPARTVSRLASYYRDHFAGPLLLLAAGLLAPLATPRRAVVGAALATAASILIWMKSPFTGVFGQRAFDVGTGDATRYLLPGVAAAATAVALAARTPGWRRALACALLAAAAVLGLVNSFRLGFPNVPAVGTPVAGAVAGALVALAVGRLPLPRLQPTAVTARSRLRFPRPRPAAVAARSRLRFPRPRPAAVAARSRLRFPRPRPAAVAALAVIALAAGGALAAHGYVRRYARSPTPQSPVAGWIDRQPAWRDRSEPVASTFSLIAPLAGDRLQHRLELLSPREPCARLATMRLRAWIVLDRPAARFDSPGRCLRALPPAYADEHYRAYAPPLAAAKR